MLRGHEIYNDRGIWRYKDNDEPTAGTYRECGACHLPNRPDEYDACVGHLGGVMNACCGHGKISEAYVQFDEKRVIRGIKAIKYINAVQG